MSVDVGYAYGLQTAVLGAQSFDGPTCHDCGEELEVDGDLTPTLCDPCYQAAVPSDFGALRLTPLGTVVLLALLLAAMTAALFIGQAAQRERLQSDERPAGTVLAGRSWA